MSILKTLDDYVTQDRRYILNNSFGEPELKRLRRNGLYHQFVLAPITGTALLDSLQNTMDMPWLWVVAIGTQIIYFRYVIRKQSASERISQIKGTGIEKIMHKT